MFLKALSNQGYSLPRYFPSQRKIQNNKLSIAIPVGQLWAVGNQRRITTFLSEHRVLKKKYKKIQIIKVLFAFRRLRYCHSYPT
jgi:hypothetical protein